MNFQNVLFYSTMLKRPQDGYFHVWHVQCNVQIELEYKYMYINSSKKVRKLKFDWRFLSCYQLIFLAFGINGKPCYSSLQWCAICYDYAIWGCAAHLNMGVGVKWNVPKCIAIVIQCIPFLLGGLECVFQTFWKIFCFIIMVYLLHLAAKSRRVQLHLKNVYA